MNTDNTQELLEVRDFFNLPRVTLVEKDQHVLRVLRVLAGLDVAPLRLVFGGGTALARAHKLIRRMSEDIDFKVMPVANVPVGKSALHRRLGELRDDVSRALVAEGFTLDASMPHTRNERRYMLYHLPYEGAALDAAGLRPMIQLELTYAPLRYDAVPLPVSSFVAEAFKRVPEVARIECVAIAETAAEKLVALTRRIAMQIAGLSRDYDPSLVRHIYDLHIIRQHYDAAVVADLARNIMRHDAETFARQYPAYRDDPMKETHKAMEALLHDPLYRSQYEAFQENMVYGENADFTDALATVSALIARVEWVPGRLDPS
ncbi:MAG TPA: nucleotidyl transferase AbiEii/AbiGii toxin family protein [Candidatus Baltobacteraceae bacterium]|nr:nucleotidyl transferase AbiEii/AbiGii toxin family protein [Candidatus Baltobacteraceae bacterium]